MKEHSPLLHLHLHPLDGERAEPLVVDGAFDREMR